MMARSSNKRARNDRDDNDNEEFVPRRAKMTEEEDEEISEDGAFNTEDEEEYGEFFASKEVREKGVDSLIVAGDENEPTLLDQMEDSDDEVDDKGNEEEEEEEEESDSNDDDDDDIDDSSDEDSSDEGEDDDEINVAAAIDALIEKSGKKERARKLIQKANAGALTSSNSGGFASGKSKLSLETMMGSLKGKGNLGKLKKNLERLEEPKLAVKEKLPRVLEERAERKVAYETAKKDVKKWMPLIQQNRKTKHLSFSQNAENARIKPTTAAIAATFEPENDLEVEINQVLQESGLADEEGVRNSEEKQLLEVNKIDPEQIKERQRELAKLRALMFYGEQKAKRNKKIKSKMYRKLKKRRIARVEEKELENLAKIDPKAARELEEKMALERAKERMTLKHKNTSKFIRGLLKNGGTHREHTRAAIVEQLQEEERLKKRMKSMIDDEDDSDDDGNDLAARKLLNLDEGALPFDESSNAKPIKGLMGMKFMQRAVKKQAEAALRRNGEDDDYDDEDGTGDSSSKLPVGRRKFGPTAGSKGSVPNWTGVVESESADKGDSLKSTTKTKKGEEEDENSKDMNKEIRVNTETKTSSFINVKSKAPSKETRNSAQNDTDVTSNPWLTSTSSSSSSSSSNSNSKSNGKKSTQKERIEEEKVQVSVSKSFEKEKDQDDDNDDHDDHGKNEQQKSTKKAELKALKEKRKQQAKLIRRAFAGTGTLNEDFENEKQRLEEMEEEKAMKKVTGKRELAGWGSWTTTTVKKQKVSKQTSQSKRPNAKDRSRLTKGPKHVIVSGKRNKKAAKYLVEKVPYPFTSREQYEESLRNPLGSDWNTSNTYQKAIKPDVLLRSGTIIDPIEYDSKKAAAIASAAKNKNKKKKKKN